MSNWLASNSLVIPGYQRYEDGLRCQENDIVNILIYMRNHDNKSIIGH